MDYRYLILAVLVLLAISYLYSQSDKYIHIPYVTEKPRIRYYQDQMNFDGDYRIIVEQELYDSFVNTLLKYAYMAEDKKTRTLYVYLITFQIFNLSFHHKRLERLDEGLEGVRLVRDDISYPSWNKYPNLQAAIGNLVGRELTDTEREFGRSKEEDRKMVDVYLSTLFDEVRVTRID
jgi:hypothetical protein